MKVLVSIAFASYEPRILIVRLSALGDILHTLPVLAELRHRWPKAHIGWLAEPAGASLIKDNPLLDKLHIVPRQAMRKNFREAWRGPMAALVAELRAERYDVSIDVQGLTKSAFWPWRAGIPQRIGFRRRGSRELAPMMNNRRIALPRAHSGVVHVVERNLELLRPLGIARESLDHPLPFPLELGAPALSRARALVGERGEGAPLVALIVGAGWTTKIWPATRFGELARRLAADFGCRVVITWGPGEEPLAAEALRAAGRNEAAANFTHADAPPPDAAPGVYALPKTTFMELGAVLSRARLVVGGDTGPTHLAAALGVPTLGLMGPLDARRNGPFGARCHTIQHGVPRKAPPWRNHRRWCDPATAMEGIGVDEVLDACSTEIAD